MPPLDDLIDHYLNYLLVEKGLSRSTLESYSRDLIRYREFLQDSGVRVVTQVALGPAQDREDRPDADVDVDVRRTVEGVEDDHVLGVRRAHSGHRLVVLFRGHHGNTFADS